ncbi:MAG: ABC transporter substrate-binding protein [Thermodesulfobacteriota bacterium]
MKKLIIGATVVLMLVSFALSPKAAMAAETLVIATLTPLSGPAAIWGLGGARTADMWVEKVNAAGGLKIGGKVYKVKLITYDHKSSVAEATTLTNRAVYRDNVKYVINAIIGSCIFATQTITEPAKVFLAPSGSGTGMIGPDKPYTFRASMADDQFVPINWEWITKKYPNIKSVATVNPNDMSGWHTRDVLLENWKKLGLKVVSSQVYERGTTDFAPLVTNMLAQKPDAISTGVTPPGDAGLILKEAYTQGFRGLKEGPAFSEPAGAIAIAGTEPVEGFITSIAIDFESPLMPKGMRDLASNYRAKYRDIMPATGREVIITLELLEKAWEKAGTVDVDATIAQLEKLGKTETTFGTVALGGKELYGINRQLFYPAYISTVKNGKLVMGEKFLHPILR